MSADEAAADLQVEQPAGDVLGGDVEVHLALAVGQRSGSARLVSTSMTYA